MSRRALALGATGLGAALGVAALVLVLGGEPADGPEGRATVPPRQSYEAGEISLGGQVPRLAGPTGGSSGSSRVAAEPETLPVPEVETEVAQPHEPPPAASEPGGETGSTSTEQPAVPVDPGGGVVGASGG